MKSIFSTFLLIALFCSLCGGCSTGESTGPAVSGERPAEPPPGSDTQKTPAVNQEGSGTVQKDESTAAKTGEAVGGAIRTAGEATEKGVKTGVDATVEGAKTVGKTTKDVAEATVDATKGEKKKN